MENLKLIITRSFSKKVQIKTYEPIDIFCSATQSFESFLEPEESKKISEGLFKFCKEEVEKSLKECVEAAKKEISSEDSPY